MVKSGRGMHRGWGEELRKGWGERRKVERVTLYLETLRVKGGGLEEYSRMEEKLSFNQKGGILHVPVSLGVGCKFS